MSKKVGYRCDSIYGDGYKDAIPVIAHEIFVLNNTDILDTLAETILTNSLLKENIESLSKAISEDIESEELNNFLDEAYDNPEISYDYIKTILNEIKNVTGEDIKYVLWLCDTKEDVQRYAINEKISDDEISIYNISDVVISDIGKDGKLYGYETLSDMIASE